MLMILWTRLDRDLGRAYLYTIVHQSNILACSRHFQDTVISDTLLSVLAD